MSSALAWLFDGIGTAALATLCGVGARAAVQHWRPRRSRRSRTTVYTAGADSHMADYRARLDEVIISARHNVYISGPGFDSSAKGEKQARTYAAALRSSLQRDIRVVRVQTTPIVSTSGCFLKELSEIPSSLNCGILGSADAAAYGMCADRCRRRCHSVTEFMIQMPRQLGTHRADIASTAVFIEGHPVLARAMRDQSSSSRRIHSE